MRERKNSKIIRQRLQLLDRLASFKVNHESKFLTVLEMPDGLPVLYTKLPWILENLRHSNFQPR